MRDAAEIFILIAAGLAVFTLMVNFFMTPPEN